MITLAKSIIFIVLAFTYLSFANTAHGNSILSKCSHTFLNSSTNHSNQSSTSTNTNNTDKSETKFLKLNRYFLSPSNISWGQTGAYHIMARLFENGLEGIEQQIPQISKFTQTVLISGLHPQSVESMPDGRGGVTKNLFGYWPSQHAEIDPHFGSFKKLQHLVQVAKAHNTHILIDAVPAHLGYQSLDVSVKPNYKIDGKIYETINELPKDFLRLEKNIESFDWVKLDQAQTPNQVLDLWDNVFSKKRLFGLAGFNHQNPVIKRHLIESYKKFIDAGVNGFRIDAVLYLDRFFVTEFINELNRYAQSKNQKLIFYLEILVGKDHLLKAFSNDILDRVNTPESVYFIDFPLMYESRRLVDERPSEGYQLKWFNGFLNYRKLLGLNKINLIPSIVNHDFGYPIANFKKEINIYAINQFTNGLSPIIFQGTEGGSHKADLAKPVISVQEKADLALLIKTLSESLKVLGTNENENLASTKVLSNNLLKLTRVGASEELTLIVSHNQEHAYLLPFDTFNNKKPFVIISSQNSQIKKTENGYMLTMPKDSLILISTNPQYQQGGGL